MTRTELRDQLTVMLGGRAAEEIIGGEISTGASNDWSAHRSSPGKWSCDSA